ncbi:peptidoglycan/LPS O-acetylase OafA/YrhL [Bradyrhizobium sp. AZCC 1719]|uniref:acyltransferase family protein n=1 Tax=Bradyrhizobium sp. AZCC 1719 TaxID=3117028 RepID=UPI002FF1D01F
MKTFSRSFIFDSKPMPADRERDDRYFPAIDGLRGIAVLMVLVFHFDLLESVHGGFTGVDVFFVISGFLITSIITRQINAGSFHLGRFYLNRIRRLAPALLATLFIVILAGFVWLYPSSLIELSKQAFVAQTYVANIYYWRTVNYFGIDSSSAFLLHTWSLAVEEQFYLIYPLFLIVAYRYARRYVWQIILSIFILSFCLNISFVQVKPEATFYLLPTRAWELLLGALIVWLRTRFMFRPLVSQIAGFIGVGLIAWGLLGYQKAFYFPGYFALLPTIGAALVILASTGQTTLFSTCMSNAAATYIGKISYPLYLVHWPVHIFAARLMAESYNKPAKWFAFALSLAIASLIFHMVEEPVRTNRILRSARSLRTGYLAGISATAIVCFCIYAGNGLPQRYAPEAIKLAGFAADKTGELTCQFKTGKIDLANFCRIGAADTKPTWLIYGDSHAWAAYGAFDKWLSASGQSAFFIFRHSCPPLQGIHLVHNPGCFEFNNEVLDFLNRSPEIKNILLVSTWLQARGGFLTTSETMTLPRVESIALFKRQFLATVANLKQMGMRVVIWEPVPGAKQNVPEALAKAYPKRPLPQSLEFTSQQYQSTFDFFFEALEQSRPQIDATVSPSKVLCLTGSCSATIEGRPAYFDNSHLAASASEFWSRFLTISIPPQ